MLVRSSSYQSQYIFGKDFHLRRLQKVTTESFPPAGGDRKLIGHGIYIYYIYTLQTSKGQANCLTEWLCFTPHGSSEFTQVWIAWERPAGPYLNSGHSGHSCFISCWIQWASEMWNHIFWLETLVLSHVHLFVCVLCVFPHWCYHSQEVLTSHLCPLSCCSQKDWWGEIPRSFLHVMLTGCLSP